MGMKWLKSLSLMTVNWLTLTMHFKVDGKTVKVQGDETLDCRETSLESMLKSIYGGGECWHVELGSLEHRHGDPDLEDQKFIIHTYQHSLKFIFEQCEVNLTYQNWLRKLMCYSFEIVYKLDRENNADDALSCIESSGTLLALWTTPYDNIADVDSLVRADPKYSAILEATVARTPLSLGFSVVDDHLLYRQRLMIPLDSALVATIFAAGHDSVIRGHFGVAKIIQRIATWYWEGMRLAIRCYVEKCETCQCSKYSTLTSAGLLHPLPVPGHIWEDVYMEFIEGLPRSEEFETIMVVLDRLNKYDHFVRLLHPFSAPVVARRFIEEIVRRHGIPRSIVSDRDKVFVSHFWKELFKTLSTKLNLSTAYHLLFDGQTEVVNHCLETNVQNVATCRPISGAQKPHFRYFDGCRARY